MPQFIRFLRLDGFGEDGVDLDLCRRYPTGPRAQSKLLPLDKTKFHTYYLTPDNRWFSEQFPGIYCEVHRDDVRENAGRMGPLPPELQTDRERAASAKFRQMYGQPAEPGKRMRKPPKSKDYDESFVAELKRQDHDGPFSGRELARVCDVSAGGTNSAVGKRAQRARKIESFNEVGDKLMVVFSKNGHPGVQDKK